MDSILSYSFSSAVLLEKDSTAYFPGFFSDFRIPLQEFSLEFSMIITLWAPSEVNSEKPVFMCEPCL